MLTTPLHQGIKASIKGLLISWIFTDDPFHQELFGWAVLTLPKFLLKQSTLVTGLPNTTLLDQFQRRVGWIRQDGKILKF
jgi:hypothetical protein